MPRKAKTFTCAFEERCSVASMKKIAKANQMPVGADRDALIAEANRIKMASDLVGWLTSPHLKSPS